MAVTDRRSKAYVYVIGPQCGPYKIGFSVKPDSRLVGIQCGNHEKLFLKHSQVCAGVRVNELESMTHLILQDRRIRGEWFDVSVTEAIDAVASAYKILIDRDAPTVEAARKTITV